MNTMNKIEFINVISKLLKAKKYKKKGSYWFKRYNDLTFCVNVQGSQWDTNDYYVEVGIALTNTCPATPTLLHWLVRHRCKDKSGNDRNILPDDFYEDMVNLFLHINVSSEIPTFLIKHNAVKVAGQYYL